MIIYNQDKISTKYFTKDNMIFDIYSDKSAAELLDILRRGGDISSVANVTCYVKDSDRNKDNLYETLSVRKDNDTNIPNYEMIYDEDYDDDRDSFIPSVNEYPSVTAGKKFFSDYEGWLFRSKTEDGFNIYENYTKEDLMTYLSDMVGIFPYLTFSENEKIKNMDIKELQALSDSASLAYDRDITMFFPDETINVLPTEEDALMLNDMSPYEKEQFGGNVFHPTKILDIAKKVKESNPSAVLNIDAIKAVYRNEILTYGDTRDFYIDGSIRNIIKNDYLGTFDEMFKEKYHGHSPRVLEDYLYGQIKDIHNLSKSDMEKIVEDFNQKSVAVIAKYKNPVLFSMSDKIMFHEMKKSHLAIFAAKISGFVKNKESEFVYWYNNNKDKVKDSELNSILTLLSDPTNHHLFDKDADAKENIQKMSLKQAYEDCIAMERKYNYSFKANDLAIRGRNILVTDGKMTMKTLAADDYRNFTVGYDTHCCQHYGSAGESCVYALTSDPYAGAVVIERNRDNKILAQGFVWTDEGKDTLVFDNVEFADDRKVGQFNHLFASWCKAMPYKNIQAGTQYNDGMLGWGRKITSQIKVNMPDTLRNGRHIYTDYNLNARSLKADGDVLLKGANTNLPVTEGELIPSRYDTVNRLGLSYLLSTGFPIEKIIEIDERINNHTLSDEDALSLFRTASNKEFILEKIGPTPENLQRFIMRETPEYITSIRNPIVEVQELIIADKPEKITEIADPDERLCLNVVNQNGLYLSLIKNPTYNVYKAAVTNNGLALKLVPELERTSELKEIAINSFPRILLSINSPTIDEYKLGIDKEPDIAGLLNNLPQEIQIYAASKAPTVVNSIKDVCFEAVKAAVEQDGYMIRNFSKKYPALRETAIRQNPDVIGILYDATYEEASLALSLKEDVINLIHNEDLINQLDTNTENDHDIDLD